MILHGDCLEKLKEIPDNSVDSLVCDPPAGISFMGKSWDSDKGGRDNWIAWLRDVMLECKRVMKPGAHGFVWAIPRTSHWTATAVENAGFEIRDIVTHHFGSGFPKSHNIEKATGDSRFAGIGTALKPATEHWILCRKPISEKTVAANVIRWGCGGINIDASRVGEGGHHGGRTGAGNSSSYNLGKEYVCQPNQIYTQGRFPANLILDEVAGEMLDQQSGPCKTGDLNGQPRVENKIYGSAANTLGAPRFYKSDAATGASRFFYCAKASKSERNAGLEGMPAKFTKTMNDCIGNREHNESEPSAYNQNHHPTVKPLKLMEYLIKLITPENGTVLDCFAGSGSTLVAAKRLGFKFIGIEREAEYIEIIKGRLNERHQVQAVQTTMEITTIPS